MPDTQAGFWTRPRSAGWDKTHNKLFVVQIRGQNRKGEDIGWMDHAAYDVAEAKRARNTANGLRKVYPNVPIRIVKRDR